MIASAVAASTIASARSAAAYFPIGMTGSAGPLRLGMTRAAALRFLHFPRYEATRARVRCAQYVMQLDTRRGLVGACFSRPDGRLIGFSVSGQAFCFAPGACVNGRDPVPRGIRTKFLRVYNGQNGIYYSYARQTLRGTKYGVVLEAPAADAQWSVRAMGFAPCSAGSTVKYYVPIRC